MRRNDRGGAGNGASPLSRATSALCAICALCASLAACSFDYGGGASGASEKPSAVFVDFTHTIMMRGARVFEIKADRAESYDAEGKTLLYGVSFTEFDEKTHEAVAEGRADRGLIYTQSENAEFSGSISLKSQGEDATLRAEYLSWDSGKKLLSSRLDQNVEVRKGDGTWLRGAGFSADMRRRAFVFRDSAEGAFAVEDKKQ
jgi:LPS export ABC transporter protein LptC